MLSPAADAAIRSLAGTALSCGLAGQRRRNPYPRRDWLRVSQRLASGMSRREVAAAEATDEATIDALLEEDGFRGLVASYRSLAERPVAEQTERLVRLARLAIENALSADWDIGAAFFVLREAKLGRDPAETVAKGVIKAARRRPAVPAAPTTSSPLRTSEQHPPTEPGLRLINRGAARLRRALTEEHGQRTIAVARAATTTAEAARRALALKAAGTRPRAQTVAQPPAPTATATASPAAVPSPAGTAPFSPHRPRAP